LFEVGQDLVSPAADEGMGRLRVGLDEVVGEEVAGGSVEAGVEVEGALPAPDEESCAGPVACLAREVAADLAEADPLAAALVAGGELWAGDGR
jgi:hypothetical protein